MFKYQFKIELLVTSLIINIKYKFTHTKNRIFTMQQIDCII